MLRYAALPSPPFDVELIDELAAGDRIVRDLRPEGIPALRSKRAMLAADEQRLDAELSRAGSVKVTHLTLAGLSGSPDVPVLLLQPANPVAETSCLVWMHGGGMILGDYHDVHPYVVDAIVELNLSIISVQYRLAPEHPYPAGVQDASAAVWWALHSGGEVGIAVDRVGVAGVSSGGCLAAAVALRARDEGWPAPAAQVLIYPMLDNRMTTTSVLQFDGYGSWDRASSKTAWDVYLSSVDGEDVPALASPTRAEDLSGLPPTFLDVCSTETLRDEVIDFGSRLAQANVPVDLHVWAGGFHGSDRRVPGAQISQSAIATRLGYLKRLLSD